MATALEAAAIHVPRIKLGCRGLEVSAQGLGCMAMSMDYGPPKPEPDMIALIRHAAAAGVTFFDTSVLDGPHVNEILLVKALRDGLREKGQVWDHATRWKGGDQRGSGLQRLGIDCIDLYYQHRIDTRVPIEVTVCC